jgi:hypothetical protein
MILTAVINTLHRYKVSILYLSVVGDPIKHGGAKGASQYTVPSSPAAVGAVRPGDSTEHHSTYISSNLPSPLQALPGFKLVIAIAHIMLAVSPLTAVRRPY